MEFDFLTFIKAALPIVAFLTPVVIAIVQVLGSFGVEGRWQLLASVVTGLILGVSALIAQLGVPADFAGWFSFLVVGLVTGLTASGVYDAAKNAALKAR